jgi:hypothetical protein
MAGRHALLALVGLALAGCPREVELTIHHPSECGESDAGSCVLEGITHLRTTLVRTNGTRVDVAGCQRLPEGGLCDWQELEEIVFLQNVSRPSDAIEILIEGTGPSPMPVANPCGGETILRCESFGDTVVDLEMDSTAYIWCECPLR